MMPILKKDVSNSLRCGALVGLALCAVGSPGIIFMAMVLADGHQSGSLFHWLVVLALAVFSGGVLFGLALGLLSKGERA